MDLEYFVALLCGVCIFSIVMAFIFSQSFRDDVSAQPGKVSILGVSIEGVIVVLLIGMLIVALINANNKYSERVTKELESQAPSIKLSDLPFSVDDADQAKAKIQQLMKSAERSRSTDVVDLVRSLEYSNNASAIIRSFPISNIGPWSILTNAEPTFFTVPSRINAGEVIGCPSQLNNFYEIRGRLSNDDGTQGQSIVVEITGLISRARNCEENFGFIQVACDIATMVLSSNVVTCDSNDQPKWKIANHKVPIWLTRIPNRPNNTFQAAASAATD